MYSEKHPPTQAEATTSSELQSRVEAERHNRIRIAAWAYAYEIENDPLVSDAEFDRLASRIDPKVGTGHDRLDAFFREHFSPYSGQWVHLHPEMNKLRRHVAYIRDLRTNPPTLNRPSQS